MKTKLLTLILIAGLISACASQPTPAPASQPTDEPAPASETPVSPTDTTVPPTEAPADTPTAEPVASTGVSFANAIAPILQSRCLNCHGGDRTEEGLSMKTYADLMAGSDNGVVVVTGDADNSLIIEMLINNKMPKRGPKLTPPQVQLIVDWVNQGALDN